MSFVLLLLPPSRSDAHGLAHRLLGLVTPLRLALTAQDAGATAVHLAAGAESLADCLGDARLRIPVLSTPPPAHCPAIAVCADVVIDVASLRDLHDGVNDGRARCIGHGSASVVARAPEADDRASHGPPIPLVHAHAFGFQPMQVVTSDDARRARKALLRSVRKSEDGLVSSWINRPLSLLVTRALVHTSLRPNHLTLMFAIMGAASGAFAMRGDRFGIIVGAALLQLQSVLDGCDGELARLTHRRSKLGEWLDTLADDVTQWSFYGGAAWGLAHSTGNRAYLAAGAIIVGCALIVAAIEYRYLWRIGSGDLLRYPLSLERPGEPPGAASMLRPLFRRDTFVLLTFLAALANLLGAMLFVCAAGALVILAAVIRAERSRPEAPAPEITSR